MDSWDDLIGRSVAGAFSLDSLLATEGPTALFLTSNGSGAPAAIRLKEATYDSGDILERWQALQQLNDPHLLIIKSFGRTTLEGVSLNYVVTEAADADLAEILRERPMTTDETMQIADGVVSALRTLHSAGFVHGQVVAANIFAVGETVKLRSDCAYPTSNNREGASATDEPAILIGDEAQVIDIQGLGRLLLESLTDRRDPLEGTASSALTPPALTPPALMAPFDSIIPNSLSGSWKLEQIAEALAGPPPSAANTAPDLPQAPTPAAPLIVERVVSASLPPPPPVRQGSSGDLQDQDQARDKDQAKNQDRAKNRDQADEEHAKTPASVRPVVPTRRSVTPAVSLAIGIALLAGIGVAYLLYPAHRPGTVADPKVPPPASVALPGAPPPATSAALPNGASPAGKTVSSPSPEGQTLPAGRTVWRVVVYSYNQEVDARKSAASLARKHASLEPRAFAPHEHGPFLVTLGGYMTREDAEALRKRALKEGLPRDVYVRNYPPR